MSGDPGAHDCLNISAPHQHPAQSTAVIIFLDSRPEI